MPRESGSKQPRGRQSSESKAMNHNLRLLRTSTKYPEGTSTLQSVTSTQDKAKSHTIPQRGPEIIRSLQQPQAHVWWIRSCKP